MRRSDAAQLGLFDAAPQVPPEYAEARRRLGEVLAPGEWVGQDEVLAAAGDWAALHAATRWGGLPTRDWRLPVAVRLASPGCPVYALWSSPAAAEWRRRVGIPG